MLFITCIIMNCNLHVQQREHFKSNIHRIMYCHLNKALVDQTYAKSELW